MAEEKSYEELMLRWQYFMLICDWKGLVRVIASIAALLQVAIDGMKVKVADAEDGEGQQIYQECLEILETLLEGKVWPMWGNIRPTYNKLIKEEALFSQSSLAFMRKENLQLKAEIVGLEAHIGALKGELEKKIAAEVRKMGNDESDAED